MRATRLASLLALVLVVLSAGDASARSSNLMNHEPGPAWSDLDMAGE